MIKNKFFTLVGAAALTLTLAACGEAEIEKVEAPEEAEQVVETEEVEAPETQDLKIGDTVEVDGLQVTLNSATKMMGTNEYDQPTNDFYIVLDVLVNNPTDESANVSSLLNFNLMDSSGYAQDITIMADTKGQLDGEVGPGRKLAGQIAFDVSESDYYEFLYEQPFASGQAIWVIQREEITE